MLHERTVVVEVTGIMGAGFLPGLLQVTHAQLIGQYKKIDPTTHKAARLYVRFHIDNTAAQKHDPDARDVVMDLINRKPSYGTAEWDALLAALRETDQLFAKEMNKVPQRVDLALRRGGFLQPCILLDDPHREEAMIFRGRPPEVMIFLSESLAMTQTVYEADEPLRQVLAHQPTAFNATPEKAFDRQKIFRERVKRIPGVLHLERSTGDRGSVAASIIQALIPVLPAHGLTIVPKVSVFIAHATADLQFANSLKADLVAQGVDCWLAPDNAAIGARFADEIKQRIQGCDKFLVIISEQAMKSDWVKTEVDLASSRERETGKIIIIPIRIDAAVFVTTVPWAKDVQAERTIADFSEWQSKEQYQIAIARLLTQLRGAPRREDFERHVARQRS